MKTLLISFVLLCAGIASAQDTYHEIAIDGLTRGQMTAVKAFILDMDKPGVLALRVHESGGTLNIHVGGTDLTAFLSSLRSDVLSRLGRGVDVDRTRTRAQALVRTRNDVGR